MPPLPLAMQILQENYNLIMAIMQAHNQNINQHHLRT